MRRRQEALIREQRRRRPEARIERLDRFDYALAKGAAWTAVVVLALIAILVIATSA